MEWGGKEDAWGEESYFASPHLRKPDFVEIDSHILCTPAIGDIDGDGHDELVVAASYFYDQEYYDRPVSTSLLTARNRTSPQGFLSMPLLNRRNHAHAI